MKINKTHIIIPLATAAFMASCPLTATADLQSDLEAANETASNAQARYDEAVAEQERLSGRIEELNAQIQEKQDDLYVKQAKASSAIRASYRDEGNMIGWLEAMFTGDDITDILANLDAYERIVNARVRAVEEAERAKADFQADLDGVSAAKSEQEAKVAEAETAKVAALDAQEEARAAVEAAAAAQRSYSIPVATVTQRAQTSSSWADEESAKSYIIGKESGGNYNARNGRYYGAYQLTESYLGGDYSPENQDRVAEQYVINRYGSWTGAAAFWDSHGWY